MPFVNIRIVKGVLGERATEKKADISRRVTDEISAAAGVPKEAVWVVFEDIPAGEWYVGARSVEQMWKDQQ